MPRAKVPVHQRQRALEACKVCREAKKRCSGTTPCTHCLRRGLGNSCFISHLPRAHRRSVALAQEQASQSATPAAIARRVPQSSSSMGDISPVADTTWASGGATGFRPVSPSESRNRESTASDSDVAPPDEGSGGEYPSAKPPSRMLLNLRGERGSSASHSAQGAKLMSREAVYIGRGSSLSFLQLVRTIVSDHIGPSQFSRNGRNDTMLEKESPELRVSAPSISNISPEARQQSAECFYSATGGLIDVFLPGELEALLESPDCLSCSNLALVDLVVAIGLQCEPSPDTHDRELAYFREAQSQAFSGMLEDPDIDMVRLFLIMSFYLLGECRRNTAFLYLGISARAAVALGLHCRETYTNICSPKHQLRWDIMCLLSRKIFELTPSNRLRVWMSLRVLDIVVNSILGRPIATAGMHSDLQPLIEDVLSESKDGGFICLGASYGVVSIMNEIVHRIYDRKDVTIGAVEALLRRLNHWREDLPDSLLTAPSSDTESSSGKESIGRVHVSCIYYFAVTLVTRPILVSTLTQQAASGLVHRQLASACLDAAMFMVQTCTGARDSSLLQANMCILKATIFLAGLVLGFEVFAKAAVDFGIGSAFYEARDLLGCLGVKSPQAALYHDILTSLASDINRYHQRSSFNGGRSTYVHKLFQFSSRKDGTGGNAVGTSSPWQSGGGGKDDEISVPLTDDSHRVIMDDVMAGWSQGQDAPGASSEILLDWDSLDISQWENFAYPP
ncbi:GAL4 [Geosmithia morbida]|uniref:GAL4 n=1 Tax=Geosmithia morbida TaxID=1094350 RepID=A0A9P4YVS4_9HYPO|nr:GAL4 [Geosmithia morbida]KAF4121919.1 GAL4 [Geosmithia morbida]